MAWKILWSDQAFSEISKFDKESAVRIIQKIETASENPPRYFERLKGFDEFKLRVGDYRIIALLLHPSKTLFIETVGHRKNIYQG
jgi:mRNA interferase RelE/StbE